MPETAAQSESPIVVKVGGSLFQLPDLADRILNVLAGAEIRNALIVTGGGEAADLVRDWEKRFDLTDETCHNLAVQAMSLNARLLASLHDSFALISHVSEIPSGQSNANTGLQVLDAAAIVQQLEKSAAVLPRSWDVTSDSISAWIAECLGIRSLLLLKSVSRPDRSADEVVSAGSDAERRNKRLQAAVQTGLVDQAFPQAAEKIDRILWCNLRHEKPQLSDI